MENQELLQKIRSVKYCLMAHPHNEPDSEFADRIDDLQEIEDNLESPPPIQAVEEANPTEEDVNLNFTSLFDYVKSLQAWFNLTDEEAGDMFHVLNMWNKKRFIENSEFKPCGAEHQAIQQPVRKTLDELSGFADWLNNNWFIPSEDGFWKLDTKNIEYQRTIPPKELDFFDSEELVKMYLNKEGES